MVVYLPQNSTLEMVVALSSVGHVGERLKQIGHMVLVLHILNMTLPTIGKQQESTIGNLTEKT
jgi:hypothetical protein